MCTVVYYNNPKTSEEEEATRKQVSGFTGTSASFDRPNDPFFDPHWITNPDGNEKRQRWIDRIRELGYADPLQD
jgi:hypothetical protein